MTETSEFSFTWAPGHGWVSGIVLVVGKWTVGNVYYDGSRNKDDPKKYIATSSLPGLKKVLDYFDDEEQAKQRVEKATRYWLSKLYEDKE